jgi:ADP-glucose pyrophosphorylase
LLLDRCRIGGGARVRRAVVGAGAVVGDGEQVGYDDEACAMAVTERRQSGLTLVLARPTSLPSVAAPRGHG